MPLLLALGVGSGCGGGGGGGGGSRRRRLLAAKGGCWGSFLHFGEGDGAGLRVPAAGTGLTPDLLTLICCSFPGLVAAGIPEVRALRRVPREVPPADACLTSGRGPGAEEKRALGSPDNFGGWVGVGRSDDSRAPDRNG